MPLLLRFILLTIRRSISNLPTAARSTTPSAADTYYSHLQKKDANLEKSLARVKGKLDASCVTQVLRKCSPDQRLLGLRFFIWAGLQRDYRHSAYIYAKACNFFGIEKNPGVINDVMEAYRNEGCVVGLKMFKVVLNLCREAKLADQALCLLRKMVEFDCRPDTVVHNVVVRLFCEVGRVDEAEKLLKEMESGGLCPDLITFTVMVKGYSSVGRIEDAFGLFKKMKQNGCLPNVVVYSQLLDGVCRHGDLERAMQLLEAMEKDGGECKPNVVTYTSVIQSFCEKGQSTEALGILDRMMDFSCAPDRVTLSVLNKGFCEEGLVEEAYKVTEKVIEGGTASAGECYSSLVISLLRIGKAEKAEKIFRKMLDGGLKPDGLACSIMISHMCSKGHNILDGFRLLQEIEKAGFSSAIDSDTYHTLLVWLRQSKHLEEAAQLVKLMLDKGVRLKKCLTDQTFN